MSNQPATGATETCALRMGDHVILAESSRRVGTVQSAVALLRTVFEDHFVDPEHRSNLFFSGCALTGRHDFTVVHRGARVILSEFTYRKQGNRVVTLDRQAYAAEVLRFASHVLERGRPPGTGPEWQRQYVAGLWDDLCTLTQLVESYCAEQDPVESVYRQAFEASHGHRKRPLEVQVLKVLGPFKPRHPISVLVRSIFGPLTLHERIPVRMNQGDVVLATVNAFTPAGITVTLEGIGSGGIAPGDRLYGLQLFYP